MSADIAFWNYDTLEAMGVLADTDFQCSLVYLDPPFMTGQVFHTAEGLIAFIDKWESPREYAEFVSSAVWQAWNLLDDRGTLILHVDPKICHLVRGELEELECHLASEIIWAYRRWPTKTKNFQRMHDVLLRYVKDPGLPKFNQLYQPLAESTRKTWGTKKQTAVVRKGKRVKSSTSEEESPGVPMSDVWNDIGIIAPVARERSGYPTQKPIKLLERIIASCSDPGDMILDPFCGSGTTLEAARKLGRNSVGIDNGVEAAKVIQRRLGVGVKRRER